MATFRPLIGCILLASAVYIINLLPTKVLATKSPFEVLFNRVPAYDTFHPLGCRVYPYLRDYSPHKLSPRSIPCIFLGYHSQYKGFQCLDPVSSRIFITRHARFDEVNFPLGGPTVATPLASLRLQEFLSDVPVVSAPAPAPITPPASAGAAPSGPCPACPEPDPPSIDPADPVGPAADPAAPSPTPAPHSSDSDSSSNSSSSSSDDEGAADPNTPPPPPTSPTAPSHPMITRAKAGIFKPRYRVDLAHFESHGLLSAVLSTPEPTNYSIAIKDPKWHSAMKSEMLALQQNHTWSLVPRPKSSNIVGCRWLFRTKYRADGSIERYKARLVAQGFSQVSGLDYSHTFSPVVKAATVRIVLTLAIINGWSLRQLDVNNAFLHGTLGDTVFMQQLLGFVDTRYPDHVCKLNKAIYGLKQAPRAWFHRLSTFLVAHGFSCSRADPSLFIFRKGSCLLYLLVYVDDLILTGSDTSVISSFVTQLHAEFRIKDLGRLSYFLGLEASHLPSGLFLSQAKYAHDIVSRAGLLDAKPMPTPLASSVSMVRDGVLFDDPTHYRSLVGALQYLTITRPDISYVVNQVSQYLAAPTVDHFQAVKRLIRYVKGTITYGLTFSRPSRTTIVGYSDVDWARCLDTRRSTYGYSIFLGGNLVSWSAKKQPTVSRSSCESEYRAMANTAVELMWVTHLLRELHALPPGSPTLLCDNQSALFLTQNPVAHKRAKHIDLDYHFVRELVASGKLVTMFVPTKLQVESNPTIPIRALQEQLQRRFKVDLSRMKTFRAKSEALNLVQGDFVTQYSLLRDYIVELQTRNPDTTVRVDVESEGNPDSETRTFRCIYICLGALKKGFAAGKRDFLGFDGAFMKGPFPGQILSTVGLDGNNGTYPLAYAVVETENISSWTWFLSCLGEDLGLNTNSNFTFITDRQKGILNAIATLFPCAENRYCVRHIRDNMRKQWRGKPFEDLLWTCATATHVQQFNKGMEELKKLNKDCYEWLKKIPPQHWSRSHFTGRAHSDVILNNLCETFNGKLNEGRDKPIITCLEFIREYLMKKIVNVSGPWMEQCAVDVVQQTCSCRKWELTGMPCKHVVATIWEMRKNSKDVGIPET
uniref:SWIM-type domain-containing protein n=1 Tax=Lactuca sativa TaxID=4236 RepID=A0A9R1W1S0_LACSA|nr:hypothetical protein LSAT_V11C400171290 [Lactuca sativa]